MTDDNKPHEDATDLSLVLGGPLYQIYLRSRLARPPLDLLRRRIFAIAGLTWLPLIPMTAVAGKAFGGVAVPFLLDLDAHARFLLMLPLLVVAEKIVHGRIQSAVKQFVDRDLIAPEDRPKFEAIIESNRRIRNSVAAEGILLILAFTVGYWIWRQSVALHVSTWYATIGEEGAKLTLAGYWYAFVSLPIARFILGRWYFRLFIWYRFLWQVSRLPLRLNALHPDRAGGLDFLGNTLFAFSPILLAHTCLLSGLIGNHIWHEGATLPQFKLEILSLLAILMLVVVTPLTFFGIQLEHAKRSMSRAFGQFASRYTNEFRQKWIEGAETAESSLGSADIQSLADLGNSYDVVREMRVLPFSRSAVIHLALLTALPLAPLLLTMVPLDEIVDRLFKLVL